MVFQYILVELVHVETLELILIQVLPWSLEGIHGCQNGIRGHRVVFLKGDKITDYTYNLMNFLLQLGSRLLGKVPIRVRVCYFKQILLLLSSLYLAVGYFSTVQSCDYKSLPKQLNTLLQ